MDDDFGDVDLDTTEEGETPEELTYEVVRVVNDPGNPGLVTASISGNQLTLHYLPDQLGTAKVTLRATDHFGATVEMTFDVNVENQAPVIESVALNLNRPTVDDTLVAYRRVRPA